MDKASYLAQREKLHAAEQEFRREKTCYTCNWLEAYCLCPLIQTFDTDTRFVILMHPMEAKKEKLGTGRVCHATLKNSEIIVGIDFTLNARVNSLIEDPTNLCRVLYPGEKSLDISTGDVHPLLSEKTSGRRLVLFLIDGTWQCAKKMMKLSKNVRQLDRISFTASHHSIFHIKQQPASFCLSTLESIHFFLGEANRRGLENLPEKPQDNLLVVFKHMINFMLNCALDPTKSTYRGQKTGYTNPENRTRGKRKTMRSIVLLD